jgi:hypothetical protein
MFGQGRLNIGVLDGDRQDAQAEVGDRLFDPGPKRQRESQFLQAHFDGDFPDSSGTEEKVVGRVGDGCVSRRA